MVLIEYLCSFVRGEMIGIIITRPYHLLVLALLWAIVFIVNGLEDSL